MIKDKRIKYFCVLTSIACSEPFGVMFTNISESTITVEWNKSAVPNGIVDKYMVRDQF